MTGRIGHPKPGEPGYPEYLDKKNARRRARWEDPAYRAKEKARRKKKRLLISNR